MNTAVKEKTDTTKSQQSNEQVNGDFTEQSTENLEEITEADPEIGTILDKLDLDSEDKDEVESVLRAEMFSGPLPHPSHLMKYAQVDPQAPEVIFGMAKKQQNHKHYMEQTHIDKYFGMEKLSLLLGFILAFSFLVGGFFLIAIDKEVIGIATVISGVVTVFFQRKSTSNDSVEQNPNNKDHKDEPIQN